MVPALLQVTKKDGCTANCFCLHYFTTANMYCAFVWKESSQLVVNQFFWWHIKDENCWKWIKSYNQIFLITRIFNFVYLFIMFNRILNLSKNAVNTWISKKRVFKSDIMWTMPSGKRLILHEQTVAFHANLIYAVTLRQQAAVSTRVEGHLLHHRVPANSKPAGSTLRLTRFPKPETLSRHAHCHYWPNEDL